MKIALNILTRMKANLLNKYSHLGAAGVMASGAIKMPFQGRRKMPRHHKYVKILSSKSGINRNYRKNSMESKSSSSNHGAAVPAANVNSALGRVIIESLPKQISAQYCVSRGMST